MGLRVVTFKVEEEFLNEIDYYSMRLGMTRSEFIRMAIEKMIESIVKEADKPFLRETLIETVIY